MCHDCKQSWHTQSVIYVGLSRQPLADGLGLRLSELISSSLVFAADAAEWSYQGATAPEHWAELSPAYATCKAHNQTPVDIRNTLKANLPPLYMAYSSDGQKITNTGHTIQIN